MVSLTRAYSEDKGHLWLFPCTTAHTHCLVFFIHSFLVVDYHSFHVKINSVTGRNSSIILAHVLQNQGTILFLLKVFLISTAAMLIGPFNSQKTFTLITWHGFPLPTLKIFLIKKIITTLKQDRETRVSLQIQYIYITCNYLATFQHIN